MSSSEEHTLWYRSGAAARLAGLPVETLRVWERRYGLSDTQRSERGQRLYSAQQVQRLGLLKLLVDQGHSIGQLAHLGIEALRELIGAGTPGPANGPAAPCRVAVVGRGLALARRIEASGISGLALQASWARIDQVEKGAVPDVATDVLVVELPELDESVLPAIAQASDTLQAHAVLVLYRFCASATIRALRGQGWLVARVPAEMGELHALCRAALDGRGEAVLPAALPATPASAEPRRFDETALADITAAGNRLACECPRHLADLLLMVGSFERYSANCASRSPADQALHRDLELAAGRARAVLEGAMQRLAEAEGLPLPSAAR